MIAIELNQEVYLKEAEVTKCNTQLHTLVNYKVTIHVHLHVALDMFLG